MLRTGLIFVALAATDFHIEPKGSEAMKLSLKPMDSMQLLQQLKQVMIAKTDAGADAAAAVETGDDCADAAAAVETGAVKGEPPVQPNVPLPSAEYIAEAKAKREKQEKLRLHFYEITQGKDFWQLYMSDHWKDKTYEYYCSRDYVDCNKEDVQEMIEDMNRHFLQ